MSALAEYLKAANPGASAELAARAAAEIRALASGGGEESQDVELLTREIGRLKRELSAHEEGVAGASRAALDTLGERARQRRQEGYDDLHDDGYDDFALLKAALAYGEDALLQGTTGHSFTETAPPSWPWNEDDWKPKGLRRMLVNMGALVIAEMERLDRAEESKRAAQD